MPRTPPEQAPGISARDFPGLATRADPDDLADGAGRDQVNVTSHRPGELRSRPGLLRLLFEPDDPVFLVNIGVDGPYLHADGTSTALGRAGFIARADGVGSAAQFGPQGHAAGHASVAGRSS